MLDPVRRLYLRLRVFEGAAGRIFVIAEIELVLLASVVSGDDDKRSIEELVCVQRVDEASQLFVGDSQRVRKVILARNARESVVVLFAEHVTDSVNPS